MMLCLPNGQFSLLPLQRSMADVSLAQHILRATSDGNFAMIHYYHPLEVPHMSDT